MRAILKGLIRNLHIEATVFSTKALLGVGASEVSGSTGIPTSLWTCWQIVEALEVPSVAASCSSMSLILQELRVCVGYRAK